MVLTAIAAIAFSNRGTGTNLPDPLPPMTLTYEVYGASVSVGNRSIPRFKELRRLEYRAQNDWTETVIESPTLDLGRYGTGSDVGSYMTIKGNTETRYDAMSDTTSTQSLGNGAHLPNGAFGIIYAPPTNPLGPGSVRTGVATEARVCFNGDCEDNASGRQIHQRQQGHGGAGGRRLHHPHQVRGWLHAQVRGDSGTEAVVTVQS